MEQTDKGISHNAQLIYVGRKDTTRLLEAYVRRSISLNDGPTEKNNGIKPRKWMSTSVQNKRPRRYSSDNSIHLEPSSCEDRASEPKASETEATEPEATDQEASEPKASGPEGSELKASDEEPAAQPKTSVEKEKGEKVKKKKSKKNKKPSFWRSFVGFFSRKEHPHREVSRKEHPHREELEPSPAMVDEPTSSQQSYSPTVASCLPLSGSPSSRHRTKSKKRFSKRRLSFRKPSKKDLFKDSVRQPSAQSVVDPHYSYYEKVSEELEKIVHEVQETETLTDDEVINRIIILMKQQGDAIDNKLNENPSLSAFFQRVSYASFQKLADTYVETETPTQPGHPTVPHTAPELVKLAFTLDFTARVAGLSRHATNYIMGLGNRYLEDRFAYTTQAVPDGDNDPE